MSADQTTIGRLIAEASVLAGGDHPCAILGHVWVHIGGTNCGCHPDAQCSVPIHECSACGDVDYGDNDEANEQRTECKELADA